MVITGAIIIEGHVQGLSNTRSLGEIGVPVIVVDKNNCIARYSKYCKKFFYCPDFKSEEFISFLLHLAEKENLSEWLLLPSNDHAVFNISTHHQILSKHYKLITPRISIVENIYNKERLIKIANKSEVPAPISWFPNSYDKLNANTFKFPCLIKGKFGLNFYKKAGKKAFLANNQNELVQIVSLLKEKMPADDLFIQELLPYKKNKTISYTAFCENGYIKAHWTGIKLREHPVNFGTATYAKSIKINEVELSAQKLLKELNYTGVCEVEFLFDPRDNQYKLIEINARTWLWVELAKKSGVNYAVLAYHYVHEMPNNYTLDYQVGKEWMHYITDAPFSILGFLKGAYTFKELIKSYLRFPKPAVFSWKDIIPFFAELLLIPLHLRKR